MAFWYSEMGVEGGHFGFSKLANRSESSFFNLVKRGVGSDPAMSTQGIQSFKLNMWEFRKP